ncbi:beta-phosphoglucomutase [Pseudomonas lurida]
MNELSVIFDIDGVVIDSEQLHFNALMQVVPNLARNFKPENLIGLSLDETLRHLKVNPEQIENLKVDLHIAYESLLSDQFVRPGIKKLIRELKDSKISYGYVSSAPRDTCLLNLALIENCAPLLIAGDDVIRTKPYPDPYLQMIDKLGAHADDVIVVEDTDIGINSATAAGITKVYAWPHSLSSNQNYKLAYRVIDSLNDISEFQILKKLTCSDTQA